MGLIFHQSLMGSTASRYSDSYARLIFLIRAVPNSCLHAQTVYTAYLANQLLGFATFPWDYGSAPYLDGVVIHTESLPSNTSTFAPYNKGRTATHEIGHWLGLYHPFQNDTCASRDPGDYVSDTPQQSTPTFGCPARKDSCTWVWGLDSVSSFMDYTDDACMQRFTTGQRQRMNALSTRFRAV
ncbi:hypothetical protein V8E36_006478 [Tilletia maclaganii]